MLLASLAACASGPIAVPTRPARGPTWSDVAPDLVRCAGCHDHGGLVFPLTTYREVAPEAALVARAVADRVMPPFPAGPADVAYLDDPRLDQDQIDRIVAWADAGAPLGDADPDAPLPAAAPAGLPRIDAELTMPEPYTPSGDQRRCFVLDRSALDEPYVTGVEVVPGDVAVVHHEILTAIVPSDPRASPAAADAADPGPGFDCSVTTLASYPGSSEVLGGWLPGRGPDELPAGSGIAVDPDAELVLEVHYYAPTPAGSDRSSVRLATAREVERPAVEIRVTHPDWSQHREIAVRAHDTSVQKLKTTVHHELAGALDGSGGLRGWWVLPHMHQLGVSIELDRVHDGERAVLVDVPAWDYGWQLTYWFADPVALDLDDELLLTCTYDNPTDEDVWWGEDTTDEMCVARLLVTGP